MLAQERYDAIMKLLGDSNIIRISEITKILNVSNETARRDLETLQDQKLLKRVHGGAVLVEHDANVYNKVKIPRIGVSYSEKMAIGKRAASLVGNGETILLDIGSTTLQIARHLKNVKDLTVLTTSLAIVNELSPSEVNVVLLGGKLAHDEQLIYSPFTEEVFEKYYVDKSFFSGGGVTLEGGVTDYSETCLNRRTIRSHSTQMILCADSEKFGKNALVLVCPIDLVDFIISDTNLKREYVDEFAEAGVKIMLAEALPQQPEATAYPL